MDTQQSFELTFGYALPYKDYLAEIFILILIGMIILIGIMIYTCVKMYNYECYMNSMDPIKKLRNV